MHRRGVVAFCSRLPGMSRIEIPESVLERVAAAAAEKGLTTDELATQALAERFKPRRRTLRFGVVGASTSGRTAGEAEDLLTEGGFGVDSADR